MIMLSYGYMYFYRAMDTKIIDLNSFLESASDTVKSQFLESISRDSRASKAINCVQSKGKFLFVINWAMFEDLKKIYELMMTIRKRV